MPTKNPTPKTKAPEYIVAVGRRKRAVARVRLYPKQDKKSKNIEVTVNEKPIGQYFTNPLTRLHYAESLKLTNTLDRFSVTVKVSGSGQVSQLEAIELGIARALVKVDEEFRPILRKNGLLTRDPRKKERRKIGTGGKARRQKQSPKR